MNNEMLNKALNNCAKCKEEDLCENEKYVKAQNNYSQQFDELRKYLPAEKAVGILDKLTMAEGEISEIEKNYFYKEGFKDGMDIILNAVIKKDLQK